MMNQSQQLPIQRRPVGAGAAGGAAGGGRAAAGDAGGGYGYYGQQQPPQQQQQQQQQRQQQQQQHYPRQHQRPHNHQDELHMAAGSSSHDPSPRDFPPPQIKLDFPPATFSPTSPTSPSHPLSRPGSHAGSQPHSQPHSLYSSPNSSVPGILHPGGNSNMAARPPPMSANTAPTLPTIHDPAASQQHQHHHQQSHPQLSQDYHQQQLQQPHQQHQQAQSKPALSLSHNYSRSSPAAGYEPASTSSNYNPYTPTTPSGSSSQFMSPSDVAKYNAPGAQRAFSNTPLGLADIRPRADSSMSDAVPGTLGYDLANSQPGTSNYLAPWPIYAFDWCKWPPQGNGAGKLAVGSYLEDGHNFIQILDSQLVPTPQDAYTPGSSKYSLDFTRVAEATHSYPVTRLLWEPPSSQKQSTDLLATSGDHLRLWSLPSETPATPGNTITRPGRDAAVTKLTPLALLSNSKTPDHTAPLTSLDWNTVSPSLIITSSIDTTCTIWDIPSLTAKTQLIAHDKEVYDVRFCAKSVDVFVSCGQDGSVRMFDLRSLEHSTIIYEPTGKEEKVDQPGRTSPTAAQQTMSNPPPLLRLATSPHETHLLATFAQDSNTIRILDVRQPGQALLELRGHSGSINCLDWSPLRRGTLASGGDDCQVLLWDLLGSNSSSVATPMNGAQQDNSRSPVACWECDYEVGNLGWVPQMQGADRGEWLGVSAGRGIWGTRVM